MTLAALEQPRQLGIADDAPLREYLDAGLVGVLEQVADRVGRLPTSRSLRKASRTVERLMPYCAQSSISVGRRPPTGYRPVLIFAISSSAIC